MNFQLQQKRSRLLISLTPLIDVVFILLLFFMLASNFSVENSLAVQARPGEGTVAEDRQAPAGLIVLDRDHYELDGVEYGTRELAESLARLLEMKPDLALSIRVGKAARVQALLDVIALADDMGIARVTMESSTP